MQSLLMLLLLSVVPLPGEVPLDARHPEAVELFACEFGVDVDQNYDQWPDEWTRRGGPRFPRYIDIGIVDDEAAVGDHSLRMQLNGGAATVYSPPIAVRDIFSYVLEGRLKTAGLNYDRAYLSITFYDHNNEPVETHESDYFRQTDGWTKVRIGPVAPSSSDAELAVIGLHIKPTDGQDEDLTGSVWFDDIWFARLPRMSLTTVDGVSIYTAPDNIKVRCEVTGILERDPTISFELVDVSRQPLATFENRLSGRVVARKSQRASQLFGKKTLGQSEWGVGFAGDMTWTPDIPDNGFYEVHATMTGASGLMHRRIMTLAVVPNEPGPVSGEFGWTLPTGEKPLDFQRMFDLLSVAGLNWVKFPVWYDESDSRRASEVVRFAERLKKQEIEMIAMVDTPPESIRYLFGESDVMMAASIFAEPVLWRPYLEPILTRLSLKVRYWQLGGDNDISFVGYRNLEEKLRQIRRELRTAGQDIHLGIPWRWMADQPMEEDLGGAGPVARKQGKPWEFLAYSPIPADGELDLLLPLTEEELGQYIDRSPADAQRFTTIFPLPRSRYSTEERARDLLEKMLAAKIHQADAVFIPMPFDREYGLMNEDGSPSELLLPWRTTAQMISGAEYLGSLQLPGESHNHVFHRDGKTCMILWNQREGEEVLFLGEKPTLVDLWGRTQQPENRDHQQVIPVGPIPTFVTGLDEGVARLRISYAFQPAQLESDFGRSQRLEQHFDNPFPSGISGTARLVGPEVWEISPPVSRFKLPKGGEGRSSYNIMLRADASSGSQPVRLDFELSGDQEYRFSVYRTLQVGSGLVRVESIVNLDAETGELILEVQVHNLDERNVSFDVLLYAPGRKQMRQRIMNMARGRSMLTFRLPQGEALIDQPMLLRLREIGGDRIFNHRVEPSVVVEQDE
ncbi:MAG: hypothetical protein WD045_01945 [Pirellulaceae bacterium]